MAQTNQNKLQLPSKSSFNTVLIHKFDLFPLNFNYFNLTDWTSLKLDVQKVQFQANDILNNNINPFQIDGYKPFQNISYENKPFIPIIFIFSHISAGGGGGLLTVEYELFITCQAKCLQITVYQLALLISYCLNMNCRSCVL